MSDKNKHIDELIRQKLDGFEMKPPASVWTDTKAEINRKGGNRLFFIIFLGFIMIGVLGSFYFFRDDNQQDTMGTDNAKAQRIESTNDSIELNQNSIAYSKNAETKLISKSSTGETNNVSKVNTGVFIEAIGSSNDEGGKISDDTHHSSTSISNANSANDVVALNYGNNSDGANSSMVNDPITDHDAVSAISGENSEFIRATSDLDLTGSEHSNREDVSDLLKTRIIEENPFKLPKNLASSIIAYKNSKINNHRFLADLSYGMSTFRIQPSKSAPTELSSLLANSATNRMGYDISLGINARLWRGLSLYGGVNYSKLSETVETNDSTFLIESYLDTTGSYWDSVSMEVVYVTVAMYDSTSVLATPSSNSYEFVRIPFGLSWTHGLSTRSDIEFRFGGLISVYSKHQGRVIANQNGSSILASTAYRTNGVLSITGAFRYIYHIQARHSLYIEPWISHSASLFSLPNLNYQSRLVNGGVRIGYRIQL